MPHHVALLRGIAPSGRNMTNDRLRGVFERLGLADVRSVLSSGNISFRTKETDAPGLERRAQAALVADLGVSSTVILRSAAELCPVVDSDPFAGLTHGPGTHLTATFVQAAALDVEPPTGVPPQDARARVVRHDVGCRAVLAVTDATGPAAAPAFVRWLEHDLGTRITMRSRRTVERIAAQLDQGRR